MFELRAQVVIGTHSGSALSPGMYALIHSEALVPFFAHMLPLCHVKIELSCLFFSWFAPIADSLLICSALVGISIAAGPTVTLTESTVNFLESAGTSAFLDGATIDNDGEDVSVVITLTNPDWDNDGLESSDGNAVVTIGDEDTGVKPSIAFPASAVADMATSLETVSFTNSEDSPSLTSRSVELTVTDERTGAAVDAVTTTTVTITMEADNDAPQLAITAATNSYTEDGAKQKILAGATVTLTDPDDVGMSKLEVTLENHCDPTTDVLSIDADSDVGTKLLGSWQEDGDCKLVVEPVAANKTAPISDWIALMQDIQFHSTNSSVVNATDRHFQFQIYDSFS